MKVGQDVLVFSASGTFRGEPGVITEVIREGARVLFEGESAAMAFSTREIIPLESTTNITGAE